MKRNLLLFLLVILFADNAFAEAFICDKMQGVLFDTQDKINNISFSEDNEVLQYSSDTNKIMFITGNEEQEFFKIRESDNYLTGIAASENGAFILTFDKNTQKLFYSKQTNAAILLIVSQYVAKCKKLK